MFMRKLANRSVPLLFFLVALAAFLFGAILNSLTQNAIAQGIGENAALATATRTSTPTRAPTRTRVPTRTPTINPNINAAQVDNIFAAKTPVANMLMPLDATGKFPLDVIPQGTDSGLDADMLDNLHAAKTPVANMLMPLDATGKFPLGVMPQGASSGLDADKLDGAESTAFQQRVTGNCTVGSAIKSIASDGTVTCEDIPGGDITSVTAGTGLAGGGVSGEVTLDVNFAGTGSATTVARSDHNHDTTYIAKSGGTMTGDLTVPSLSVTGSLSQSQTGNGTVKAAVLADCKNVGATIYRSFNNVNTNAIQMIDDGTMRVDECMIDFGFSLDSRYIIVSPAMVTCNVGTAKAILLSVSGNRAKIYRDECGSTLQKIFVLVY